MCWVCRTVRDTMEAMTRARLLFSGVVLLLGAAVLSGCSTGDDDGAASRTSSAANADASESASRDGEPDVPVLQPGLPGEPNVTTDAATPAEPAPWNHADIAFVQMMIPHHAQALEMSRLARTRTRHEQVLGLAERVEAGQRPEILLMASWLEEQGIDVPSASDDPMDYDHSAHGHDGMEGMLSARQLEELAAARGRAFDRLWLTSMIGHHQGALLMADRVSVEGSALPVRELAADVFAGQSAEIDRMRELLARL